MGFGSSPSKGDIRPVLFHFQEKVDEKILEYVKKVKPSSWASLKTECIDFSKDFIWLDDYPMYGELQVLEKRNLTHKLIKIDLISNPDHLLDVMEILKSQA